MNLLSDSQRYALKAVAEIAFNCGQQNPDSKFTDTVIGNEYQEIFYRIDEDIADILSKEIRDEIKHHAIKAAISKHVDAS